MQCVITGYSNTDGLLYVVEAPSLLEGLKKAAKLIDYRGRRELVSFRPTYGVSVISKPDTLRHILIDKGLHKSIKERDGCVAQTIEEWMEDGGNELVGCIDNGHLPNTSAFSRCFPLRGNHHWWDAQTYEKRILCPLFVPDVNSHNACRRPCDNP